MPIVSVTRFRARSICFVPLFLHHANRTIAQARKADGFLAGAVQGRADRAFWTMSVWRDQRAMQAYSASGPHRTAMPHLRDWGVEASVVRWETSDTDLPDWPDAVRRMRESGRASLLRHPGKDHAALSYADEGATFDLRL